MSSRERANILLVDDQPSRLLSYEAILGDLGQNLVYARSGTEALQRLMEKEFAVILLDISMPEMDGFETASLIHQHPRFEKTPIIFVTAVHVTDLDRLKGYEMGAVDYVYIPVIPEILRSKVAVLVELHGKRRELQRLNRSLEEANLELAQLNSTLQAEKTRELERLNQFLEQANAELARANRSLQAEIVEREQLEGVLKQADRRKDEFLALLSHELRNPLAPVRNAVEIMRLKDVDDPELLWCRGVIERQVEQLTRLVDDLMDVSRISSGRITLQSAPVDLAQVASGAVETSQPGIDSRGHQLEVDLPSEPVLVSGDAPRLTQVIANLLNNAAKYQESPGRIRLSVRRDGAEAIVRVGDTGVGLDPRFTEEIFELFTQAHGPREREPGGLGIGLALVRKLVELHGGRVEAASEGPGRGSEFVVRLPLLAGRPGIEPRAQRREAVAPAASRPSSILVVDDNTDAAESLGRLLEHLGCEVEITYDGPSALEAVARRKPEVVMLDIGMAEMDGFEVARRLRASVEGRDLAIVALTGWGQEGDRRRSREAGCDHHLVKPVSREALERLLGTLAGRPRARTTSQSAGG